MTTTIRQGSPSFQRLPCPSVLLAFLFLTNKNEGQAVLDRFACSFPLKDRDPLQNQVPSLLDIYCFSLVCSQNGLFC